MLPQEGAAAHRGVVTTMASRAPTAPRLGLLRDLDHPSQVFAHITPNWFAVVMGTGIVAVAASSLPYQPAALHTAAIVVWALAAALLVVVTTATLAHWRRHPAAARRHLDHPVTAPFHGAPPMALLTVGAGTLLLGRDVIGLPAAVAVDVVLWTVGTVAGLVTAVAVPHRMFVRHGLRPDRASGGWLMPVVPPMVSASTGALLVPHAPAGAFRLTLLLACYLLFVLSACASTVVIALVVRRLATHGPGDAASVPTLCIVLGPLGQSVTAANLLGGAAHTALPTAWADHLRTFGIDYGIPVWGLALAWAAVAATVTVRTARVHLPFGLTWWSFTFPMGTVVTATSGLALHTGSTALAVVAAVLFVALVGAWVTVSTRTARGCFLGRLFLPAGAVRAR